MLKTKCTVKQAYLFISMIMIGAILANGLQGYMLLLDYLIVMSAVTVLSFIMMAIIDLVHSRRIKQVPKKESEPETPQEPKNPYALQVQDICLKILKKIDWLESNGGLKNTNIVTNYTRFNNDVVTDISFANGLHFSYSTIAKGVTNFYICDNQIRIDEISEFPQLLDLLKLMFNYVIEIETICKAEKLLRESHRKSDINVMIDSMISDCNK